VLDVVRPRQRGHRDRFVEAARATAWRWVSLSFEGWPGDLPSSRPSGPRALNRSTQSWTIWSPTPPSFAASLRVPPS
jgi:hypothetical protein